MALDLATDVMTTDEAAEFLGIERVTVNMHYTAWKKACEELGEILVAGKYLPGLKKGRDVLFRRSDVEKFRKVRESNGGG